MNLNFGRFKKKITNTKGKAADKVHKDFLELESDMRVRIKGYSDNYITMGPKNTLFGIPYIITFPEGGGPILVAKVEDVRVLDITGNIKK